MDDWRLDRIGAAHAGRNPTVLARLPGGFAVIGDVQWLPGYSVLLTDDPAVDRLTDLPVDGRIEFLTSMERLAHVWPRYGWEPAEIVGHPVWRYPQERWSDPAYALGRRQDALRRRIAEHLAGSGPTA